MKLYCIIFGLLLTLVSSSQISMQTNLPPVVNLNSEINFDVRIIKGNYTNFSKFQLELPQDVKVQEVDSRLGSFASEEGRIKIIWVIAPPESDFVVKLKLITGNLAGQKSFVMKYFFMDLDTKKEVEMNPYSVEFKESAYQTLTSENSPFVNLEIKPSPPMTTATISLTDINTKNPEVLKQQITQLRVDSKEARVVGEREKGKAEEKINRANEALIQAEKLSDETEKKTVTEKATADKKKAEEDLEVANKVLTLAQSLEDNANEIEAINKSVNPSSYQLGSVSTAATSAGTSREDIEKLKATFDEAKQPVQASKEQKVSPKKQIVPEPEPEPEIPETGLVYKLQLGAFSKEPNRADFKILGKISIKTENGMYKVLYGSFSSKEEAFKKREELNSKGFASFVVAYQDGNRVK